jgi:hypothetical protein
MAEENKQNLQYFAASSMKELYGRMEAWQHANQKRFLSLGVHKDGDQFCCIALTNPSEVVITSYDGQSQAMVEWGRLMVVTQ